MTGNFLVTLHSVNEKKVSYISIVVRLHVYDGSAQYAFF
jgi:hypothetical protein